LKQPTWSLVRWNSPRLLGRDHQSTARSKRLAPAAA